MGASPEWIGTRGKKIGGTIPVAFRPVNPAGPTPTRSPQPSSFRIMEGDHRLARQMGPNAPIPRAIIKINTAGRIFQRGSVPEPSMN
jgi:hypothetical protein